MPCDLYHKIPLQEHIIEKGTLPNSTIRRLDQSRFFHSRLSLGLDQIDVPAAVLKTFYARSSLKRASAVSRAQYEPVY
jgi:hypothetical protein